MGSAYKPTCAQIQKPKHMIGETTLTTQTPTGTEIKASCVRIEPGVWSTILAQFDDANFYQTYAYGSVCWGDHNLGHLVIRNANDVSAVAQVRVLRLWGWCGVAYVRWGPCVQRRRSAWDLLAFRKALEALADEFVRRRRCVLRVIPNVFCEDPEAGPAHATLLELGFRNHKPKTAYRTIRVDLTPPLDAIRKKLEPKWRNQLNAALRNNLEVVEGQDGQLFRQFLELYDEMMARKRFDTTVDPRQFARIQEGLRVHEKMFIALAGLGGRWHAGVVVGCVGATGNYLLGATGVEGLKTKASYLLQWRIMEHLRSRGCRAYDLGGINPIANPGVYHFKAGMGGSEVSQLGLYELSPSTIHSSLLLWAEWIYRLYRKYSRKKSTRKPLPQAGQL